ncbi:E3 ubiquitin-protein ligase Topors-like [Acyrthosiphon pisum]|uniref:RING-type E3 ubiquitin transferase n=1 Tax=Acyrthosiphon pisum TaxID=7029 RepID=A0A8R2JVE1_ACYPI|nr:E3 ubiquitin-protein ligase Topors-like [Acyrthosiphon pisum]
MDILNNGPTARRPLTPDSRCSICFDDVTNKCYTNACLHLFCFECLLRWSYSEPTCPLCKKTFNYIYHSFGDLGVHETYAVLITDRLPCPTPRSPRSPSPNNVRPISEMPNGNRIFNGTNSVENINRENEIMMSTLWSIYDLDEVDNNYDQLYHHSSQNYPRLTSQRQIIGQAIRMQVYIENLWAEPLPDTTGRFRHCSPAFYRDNPTQMYRLHKFILRDVVAIRQCLRLNDERQSLPNPENTDINVTTMIMRLLIAFGIRELHLFNSLRRYLDVHAAPFYQEPLPPINVVGVTVALETDNVEVRVNTEDSDVESLSHYISSIDLLNSASMDQPSTSSGIRGPLDRPINRGRRTSSSESEYGGLPRISFQPRIRRGSPN